MKGFSLSLALAAGAFLSLPAAAAEMEEIVVKGDLGSLPGDKVGSVFGFDKSLLEMPRSASTVSREMLERWGMQDIDELIALAPGSFTQSFFGVAGGLDIRGTPGETYFRGVRRLDNPGNYPTPIGASDRVDVVRGPASPIYGPAKIGGYLNFNPKTARIEETGAFLPEAEGSLSLTAGTWEKQVVSGELGGPGSMGGKELGYYLYGEHEDSGSYYDNTEVEQTLLQASFDMQARPHLRLQFGGMWHEYSGNQIAGWNRLTQALIDDGVYVTGDPRPLDTNGDGRISHQEYDPSGEGFTDFNPFHGDVLVPGAALDLAALEKALNADLSALALVNPGKARLSGNQVLVAPEDLLENQVTTLYLDVLSDTGAGWRWKNQLFFEKYETLMEYAYGFSQFHDSWVLEDKLVVARDFIGNGQVLALQLSPSIRHTHFTHGDDYTNEHFDRRDLTGPSTSLDKRIPATELDADYTEYYRGEYTDYGFAALADFTMDSGLGVLAGVRYDFIRVKSHQPKGKLLLASSNNFCVPPDDDCVDIRAEDNLEGVSWNLSLTYSAPFGLVPYVTASSQATMIAGQGAEVTVDNVMSDEAFDDSELLEAGLKGSFLDGSLYFALAVYQQERTDFSAQSTATNQSSETEGVEFEARWVVNERLLLTLGYSHIEVTNLNTQEDGARFSFVGCDDLPQIPCHLLYGGTLGAEVSAEPSDSRRAGVPEEIYTLTGTYDFGNGWTVNGSIVDVDEAPSGLSNSVTLPAYRLLNLGFAYQGDNWQLSVNGKNLTDERYFRANFPNLFGSVVVLPELPRHYQAKLTYSF